ncbi:MAG: thioredoxin family protein [Pseudomonadota bacterium]
MLLRSLVVVCALFAPLVFAAPEIGQPAPAFTAIDSNGKAVKLSDFKDKHVVLEWTNNKCPFVKKHYSGGNMQGLQTFAHEKGVVWLSVISSAPGKEGHVDGAGANALTKDRGASPSHVLLDESGAIGRLYEAKTTPHMFIVAPDGKLIYKGGIDSNASADPDDIADATPYVKVALTEALAGKPVTESSTRPYGCSIKYGS